MSQAGANSSNSGPIGPTVQQINGDTGSIQGNVVTIYADRVALNSGSTVGFDNSGTVSTLNVSDANFNTIIGKNAGKASITSQFNTVLGYGAGAAITSGMGGNVLLGYQAGPALTTGDNNFALGQDALQRATTATHNIAMGGLDNLISGGYNISLGLSGVSYTSSESSNILMHNDGVLGESNTTRIGTQGTGLAQQNKCFIAGIVGTTVGSPQSVTINSSTGQLGVSAIKNLSVVTQEFSSSGTYTPTAGMVYCIAEVVGGGGGGGGAATTTSSQVAAGAGGGGGGYSRKTISAATIGASKTVTIGVGGTAGANTGGNGGTGGTSSLGAILSATGGAGGTGGSASNQNQNAGGVGGVGSSGDFNTSGTPGQYGFGLSAAGVVQFVFGGQGGSTFFGGGGVGVPGVGGGAGVTGQSYGGGGSGGSNGGNNGQQAGGAGFAGIVVVTEYVIA